MAPTSFTEAWISSSVFTNRYKLRTTKQTVEDNRFAEEILPNRVDATSVNSKLDFFRSIGLEFSNFCDINCNNNIKNNNNNTNDKDYNLQWTYKRQRRSSSTISESFNDIYEESFDLRSKDVNTKNSESRDMVDYRKIIPIMKECSVTIIGEKCKICGRSFKCIKDLQLHTKKKHRKRKAKKQLVIKIGKEVISRVPIRRKHLKRLHKQKHQTIDSNDDVMSWTEEENGCDRISDEEISAFDNHDSDSNSLLMDESVVVLESPKNEQRIKFTKHHIDEDEDIQVLLKITRPCKSMEINHETPNRNERERLLSDAIQEFIRMDDDLIEIIEPNRDLQIYRDDSEIIEEFSRLGNNRLRTENLDGEEHNCSFHIENLDDIDCCSQEINSLLPRNNDLFSEETASVHSLHYRNENGDVIPDFIDYTHCLNDPTSIHNNNNNSVYELESSFYNEARINEWNKASCDPKIVGFDVLENTNRCLETSGLIKEEIMLEDLLL